MNPNPDFFVRISSGVVGVFRVKGSGPKIRYALRNPGSILAGIRRISQDFQRDVMGVPEKFENKSLSSIWGP